MLTLTNGTTQYIDFGSHASLTNLTTLTAIVLLNPASYRVDDVILAKKISASTTAGWSYRTSPIAANGETSFLRRYSTNNTNYTSGDALLGPASSWYWGICTFDPSGTAGQRVKLYKAPFFGAVVETATYSTTTDASSAVLTDAGVTLRLGNYDTPLSARTPSMSFDYMILYNSVLSLAQCQEVIDSLTYVGVNSLTSGRLLETRVGWEGISQSIDISGSGLNGTVSGSPTVGTGALEPINSRSWRPVGRSFGRGLSRGLS